MMLTSTPYDIYFILLQNDFGTKPYEIIGRMGEFIQKISAWTRFFLFRAPVGALKMLNSVCFSRRRPFFLEICWYVFLDFGMFLRN